MKRKRPGAGPIVAVPALNEEGRPRRRAEAPSHLIVAQRADEKEVAVGEAEVDGGDLRVRGERRAEERQGLEPRRQAGGPGEPVPRQELHQQPGRREQGAYLIGRALRDVGELVVAGGQKQPRRGAIAVADDGRAGHRDERHEQARDEHPEAEPASRRLAGGRGGAAQRGARNARVALGHQRGPFGGATPRARGGVESARVRPGDSGSPRSRRAPQREASRVAVWKRRRMFTSQAIVARGAESPAPSSAARSEGAPPAKPGAPRSRRRGGSGWRIRRRSSA